MFELEFSLLVFLFCAAFVAGFIDSIAGGGGMITLPALLLAGIPPVEVLGTNKLQASFGSFSATWYFYRKKLVQISNNKLAIICIFGCSAFGTLLVQWVDNNLLAKMLPFLLIAFAFYFLFAPKIADEMRTKRVPFFMLLLIISAIGFYDGFLGPGTGSFFLLSLMVLGGFRLNNALAHSKLYNFISNLASVLFFSFGGNILWSIGFFMAVGQFFGAYFGSKTALKYGMRIIKPLIVIVSLVACLKLLYEQYF